MFPGVWYQEAMILNNRKHGPLLTASRCLTLESRVYLGFQVLNIENQLDFSRLPGV